MSLFESELSHLRMIETESILDTLPQPTFALSADFQVIRLNRASLSYRKLENFQDAIHRHCYQLIYGRKSPCPFCPFKHDQDDGVIPPEYPAEESYEKILNLTQDSEERIYRVYFFKLSRGRIRYVESVEDITLQREKQEEEQRIENLAALGTMISGISHELNNPVTGMGLTLQNLEANITTMEASEVNSALQMLRKDLNRAARIIEDILSFARPSTTPVMATSDLIQIIHRAQANILRLYPVLSARVEWHFLGKETLPLYYCNSEKMERLFINLFRNSLQAFDYEPGNINVDIRLVTRNIHIIIEDDAGGIPPDFIKHVFNPFYSQRKDKKGSGLGLTICHSIVKEHQGRIRVWTGNGKTKFYISLPLQPTETT